MLPRVGAGPQITRNSSLTRVRPFFDQLITQDPMGEEWLGAVIGGDMRGANAEGEPWALGLLDPAEIRDPRLDCEEDPGIPWAMPPSRDGSFPSRAGIPASAASVLALGGRHRSCATPPAIAYWRSYISDAELCAPPSGRACCLARGG